MIAHINSSWAVRLRRDDLVTFQVDGTHGSAVAGLTRCWTQARVNTPRPVWNPDQPQTMNFYDQWDEVPDNIPTTTRSRSSGRISSATLLLHAVEARPGRRRERRATRRARAEELGRAALARRAEAGDLREADDADDLTADQRPRLRALHDRRADRAAEEARRRNSIVSPTRPRMWSPIRSPIRSLARRCGRLGQDYRVSPLPLGPRPRRCRSDGYRAARHRTRLERRARIIRRALEAAKARPGVQIACGVGTDHLDAAPHVTVDDVIRAYEQQIEAIEAMGGKLIVMASRALTKAARVRRIMRASMAASCGRCESR